MIQRGATNVVDFGKQAAQATQTPLSRIPGVTVVTRDRLEQIAREQAVRFDERFDRSTTPAFGKLAGVQAIVTGSIESITAAQEQSQTSVAGTGATQGVIRSAKVDLVLNAYSTENGDLLFSERVSADTIEKVSTGTSVNAGTIYCGVMKILGGDKNCNSGGQQGSSGYQKSPIAAADADALVSAAISMALDEASAKLTQRLPDVISKAPIVAAAEAITEILPPQIVAETDGEFVLNRGEEAGLAEGDTLQVQRLDSAITVGGRTIQPSTTIGVIRITSVGDGWAKGEYKSKRVVPPKRPVQAKVGDRIKLSPKP